MVKFSTIRKRAESRKGGAQALAALLPPAPSRETLAATPDDRALACMTQRIFCAGFVWKVIEAKWRGFEQAFEGFAPQRLAFEPDEFWEKLASDARIVRNASKIRAVRDNALFVARTSKAHKGFGRFLSEWPADDEIGLLEHLSRNGARLGGMTGQYFLRFIGWDGFVLSRDVAACLRDAGVDISDTATSKRDLKLAQARFNAWAKETGLPYAHLSRICAMSIGENYDAARLAAQGMDGA